MTTKQHLKQMMWISRSLVRDLRKLKFKAIFRGLWDRQYRHDIMRMRRVIGTGEYRLVRRKLHLYKIRHSHAINYPRWVNELVGKMYDTLWLPPPIKVIRDWELSKPGYEVFMVVDGNHRLAALKIVVSAGDEIDVYEMVPYECPVVKSYRSL